MFLLKKYDFFKDFKMITLVQNFISARKSKAQTYLTYKLSYSIARYMRIKISSINK